MVISKRPINNKCWTGCGEKGTLLQHWWECKLVQPQWRTVLLISIVFNKYYWAIIMFRVLQIIFAFKDSQYIWITPQLQVREKIKDNTGASFWQRDGVVCPWWGLRADPARGGGLWKALSRQSACLPEKPDSTGTSESAHTLSPENDFLVVSHNEAPTGFTC